MTHNAPSVRDSVVAPSELVTLIQAIPPACRGTVLQSVVSFQPAPTLEHSFAVGPLRAAYAEFWEARFGRPIPVGQIRAVLAPPVPIATVLEFNKLMHVCDAVAIEIALGQLTDHLHARLQKLDRSTQLCLFEASTQPADPVQRRTLPVGESVPSLRELVEQGRRFPTIYADPPWPYENEASRAAAVNHYPTMPVRDICAEPIGCLAEENAHLHLWTTNAFLRESFDVIEAWGFRFKSCLIWVKDEIGMGNYWRVSHEFLLLGVRGQLTFRDRTVRSWIQARRTSHSRKPGLVRALVETVSPGPYLELYAREELPNSAWTVYGNQIERRLF